jgi:hypothetical protein
MLEAAAILARLDAIMVAHNDRRRRPCSRARD